MGEGGGDNNSKYRCAFSFFSIHIGATVLTKSANRQADLFSIASATDILGNKFDKPANPVTPGDLDNSIPPAKYISFVNYIDSTQLARFGLRDSTYSAIPSCFLTSYFQ